MVEVAAHCLVKDSGGCRGEVQFLQRKGMKVAWKVSEMGWVRQCHELCMDNPELGMCLWVVTLTSQASAYSRVK